jgi:isopenicillin N synthase-like dioxygenase
MTSFAAIPILDLSLARSPDTKAGFLESLREALLSVGFLYLRNTGIPPSLISALTDSSRDFFALPTAAKLAIEMKNAPSFLGYSVLGNEITASATDWREQIDLSTPHPTRQSTEPLYNNLLAPNQWPDPDLVPHFRPVLEEYISRMSKVSMLFTSLVAEALLLPATAFDAFFDQDQQHKLKLVRYPDMSKLPNTAAGSTQGVGPHKDSMLTSYLLQATPHRGLQVQNAQGTWIDCPPIDETLVVAIGQGLEALTQGVFKSTTHRVLSPAAGQGARISIPFFQGVSYHARFEEMAVPEEVKRLKRRQEGAVDDVEFTFQPGRWGHLGEATLYNRVKSHQDVGRKWYPEILAQVREQQARDERERERKRDTNPSTNRSPAAQSLGREAVEAH